MYGNNLWKRMEFYNTTGKLKLQSFFRVIQRHHLVLTVTTTATSHSRNFEGKMKKLNQEETFTSHVCSENSFLQSFLGKQFGLLLSESHIT